MRFLNVRKSRAFFSYLLMIQLSISFAGPARPSLRNEGNRSLTRKYANVQHLARDDPVEDAKQSDGGADVIITTTTEPSIPTTEDFLPVEQEVINNGEGPSTASLLDEPVPDSLAIESEDTTESTPVEAEAVQDVEDPVVDSKIETPLTDVAETLPEQVAPESSSAAPSDLPLNPPVRVPMIPSEPETTPLPVKQADPVIHSSMEDSNVSSNQLKKPAGGKKPAIKYETQVHYKRRPVVSYEAPLNPYLSEEQDQPIYLPPTFSALPLAVSLYSNEEDDFPRRPKKLDFPRISNTGENFDLHVDWWKK
ncbi:uncharacterized protein LOC116932555 [Daphnia magna]|uniref:uncharacterized protein LOC116932555 n=1 Tax=Daphnia magna TaxID=35525 RepID=UPI001E1BC6BB|nr:uncharacterized protein LOC116932555 [Daphnia magna]